MNGRCGAAGWAFGALLLAAVVPIRGARGDEFYLRYEADKSFPEQEGWQRRLQDPNGEVLRWLENSVFWLDTRASVSIYDFYLLRDPAFEPGPGETLQVNWRMRTVESYPVDRLSDVKVGVCSSAQDYVGFFLGPDYVAEIGDGLPWDPEHRVPIEPGIFHDYSVRTSDLRTYVLYVDGQFAFSDDFGQQWWTPGPFVGFGDTVLGRKSLSAWDYVEVRVVPEPAAVSGALLGLVASSRVGRGRRRAAWPSRVSRMRS